MKKVIAALATGMLACTLAVAPTVTATAAPEPARVGINLPAPAWYPASVYTCRSRGLLNTYQVAWWDPMGAFGTWRNVCYKRGEFVPLFY